MRTVDISEATGSLSEYARDIRRGPVVVTRHGRPVIVGGGTRDSRRDHLTPPDAPYAKFKT